MWSSAAAYVSGTEDPLVEIGLHPYSKLLANLKVAVEQQN